jgi:MoaA/NifB/PqqE/SkfB family radical SAM enzyme
MAATIDSALLRPRTSIVYVEMTSRCNVRCVYCPVSQPDYRGEDLEVDIEELAAVLERLQPSEVQLSGHGETTMLRHWAAAARTLLARGLPLTITSNFAKRFGDEEIEVLARFRALKISVDSADAALLEELRRGVRLERVEQNMARIVQHCRATFREPPFLHISCTLTDANVPGLCELVRWSVRHEAQALALVNLVRHPDTPGALPVRHPAEVDPAAALAQIERAGALARELGLRFDVDAGLADALQEGLRCR